MNETQVEQPQPQEGMWQAPSNPRPKTARESLAETVQQLRENAEHSLDHAARIERFLKLLETSPEIAEAFDDGLSKQ